MNNAIHDDKVLGNDKDIFHIPIIFGITKDEHVGPHFENDKTNGISPCTEILLSLCVHMRDDQQLINQEQKRQDHEGVSGRYYRLRLEYGIAIQDYTVRKVNQHKDQLDTTTSVDEFLRLLELEVDYVLQI